MKRPRLEFDFVVVGAGSAGCVLAARLSEDPAASVCRPERIAARLGVFAEILHAVAPRVSHVIMNTAFRTFPDSGTARGMGRPVRPPHRRRPRTRWRSCR